MASWLLIVGLAIIVLALVVQHTASQRSQSSIGQRNQPQVARGSQTSYRPGGNQFPGRRVGAVKDRIGALRLDVGWVIDNPAFFDVDSPTSAQLFEALADWDDNRRRWSVQQLDAAADRIEGLFVQSRRRAEHIGTSHLHGATRDTVETASKLIRKALSTHSEQERQALMAKAAAMLSGVIDVVAPPETARELERQAAPRQLGN